MSFTHGAVDVLLADNRVELATEIQPTASAISKLPQPELSFPSFHTTQNRSHIKTHEPFTFTSNTTSHPAKKDFEL